MELDVRLHVQSAAFAIEQRTERAHARQPREKKMTDPKSLMIGALLVAVGVLGYMAYDHSQRTVQSELPSVKIGRP